MNVIMRPVAFVVMLGLLVFAGTNAQAAEGPLADRAKGFIAEMTATVITELTDPTVSVEEQEIRFQAIMDKYVAQNSIARWVLGRAAWRGATDQQRDQYIQLYKELMVATYAHRFQDYSGESLSVDTARDLGNSQAVVMTTFSRPGHDATLPVEWFVRETEGQMRVLEIKVAGYSMAKAHKEQFAAVLKSDRSDIAPLLVSLQEQLDQARADRVSARERTAETTNPKS